MPHDNFDDWTPPEPRHNEPTPWNWVAAYPDGLQLGYKTDIGAFCYLMARYGIEIQDFVEIGSHTVIYSQNSIDQTKGKVTVERRACIGSHCTVMPGITIGQNSIVGAHSLVLEDVPNNVIAFGVPAKVIRALTEDELQQRRGEDP